MGLSCGIDRGKWTSVARGGPGRQGAGRQRSVGNLTSAVLQPWLSAVALCATRKGSGGTFAGDGALCGEMVGFKSREGGRLDSGLGGRPTMLWWLERWKVQLFQPPLLGGGAAWDVLFLGGGCGFYAFKSRTFAELPAPSAPLGTCWSCILDRKHGVSPVLCEFSFACIHVNRCSFVTHRRAAVFCF